MPFNPLEEIVRSQTEGQFVFGLVDRLQQRPGTKQTPTTQCTNLNFLYVSWSNHPRSSLTPVIRRCLQQGKQAR